MVDSKRLLLEGCDRTSDLGQAGHAVLKTEHAGNREMSFMVMIGDGHYLFFSNFLCLMTKSNASMKLRAGSVKNLLIGFQGRNLGMPQWVWIPRGSF